MLVVVFDNERNAYEGKSALRNLELDGSISLYAGAVVTKHADGTASVKQYDDLGPVGTLAGTSVGSLIGLLGGPAGVAVGAASGLVLGVLFDADNVLVGGDFIDDVSRSLTPNKVAVIAEIDEEWTTPVDTRMEALGGTVFRRSLRQIRQDIRDEDTAAMKADLAGLKDELSKAHADRKAKLQRAIEQLQGKIDAQRALMKERREEFEARRNSRAELLKRNAAAAGRALKALATTPL
jgi:uncharacterized membrane protein